MKKWLICLLLVASIQAQAGIPTCAQGDGDCCPTESNLIVEFPQANDLRCKSVAHKVELYQQFPKLPYYQQYRFLDVSDCSSDIGNELYDLSMKYCVISTTQHMKVTIKDFRDPFYQTALGKAAKSMFLANFVSFNELHGYIKPKHIKRFDQTRLVSSRFATVGGDEDLVALLAYHNNRYAIEITLQDKARVFKTADQTEQFLKGYVDQMQLD